MDNKIAVKIDDQETFDYICAIAAKNGLGHTKVSIKHFPKCIFISRDTIHHMSGHSPECKMVPLENFINSLKANKSRTTYDVGNKEFYVKDDNLYIQEPNSIDTIIGRDVVESIYKRYNQDNTKIVLRLCQENWKTTNRIIKKMFPQLEEIIPTPDNFYEWAVYNPETNCYSLYKQPAVFITKPTLESFIETIETYRNPIYAGAHAVIFDEYGNIKIGCLTLKKRDIEGIMTLFNGETE